MLKTFDIHHYGTVQIRYKWHEQEAQHDFNVEVRQTSIQPVQFEISVPNQYFTHGWCWEVANQIVPRTRCAHQQQTEYVTTNIGQMIYAVGTEYHNDLRRLQAAQPDLQHIRHVQNNFGAQAGYGGQPQGNPFIQNQNVGVNPKQLVNNANQQQQLNIINNLNHQMQQEIQIAQAQVERDRLQVEVRVQQQQRQQQQQ